MTPLLCPLDHGLRETGQPKEERAAVGWLCAPHFRKLDSNVAEIRTCWVELALIKEAGTAPKDTGPRTRRTKSASPPAPANLEVLVQRDPRTKAALVKSGLTGKVEDTSRPVPTVLDFASSWCQLVAEERGLTGELPKSAVGQLDFVSRHLEWCAAQPWVDDLLEESRVMLRTLRTVLRDHTHKFLGRCIAVTDTGDCGGDVLLRNGEWDPFCARCKRRYVTPQEKARLAVANEGR